MKINLLPKRLSVFAAGFFLFATVLSAAPNALEISDLIIVDDAPVDRSLNGGVVSYAESVSEVRKAVVSVASKRKIETGDNVVEELFRKYGGQDSPPREAQGIGSGVIVTDDGYILTNNHVVEKSSEVTITLADGKEYEAVIVGADPQTDIAVLKIEAEDLPKAQLTNSDNIEVGDVVFAIGNPLGVGQTVTMGIISAKGRNQLNMIENGYENFIQTDAAINQGNSGGALVDAYGRVLGINTMIMTDGRSTGSIGIGFAVPTNLAHHVMTSLVDNGSVTRGFLGVTIQDLDSDLAESFGLGDSKGAIVREVNEDSPANKAGIESGDVILRVDGQVVESTSDLRLKIANKRPGAEVTVEVFRDEKEVSLIAVLEKFDLEKLQLAAATSQELFSGVSVEPLTPILKEKYGIDNKVEGLVVTGLSPDSPYARDFQEGLVINKIKNRSISTVEEAKELLVPGKKVALFVHVQGYYHYIAVEVK